VIKDCHYGRIVCRKGNRNKRCAITLGMASTLVPSAIMNVILSVPTVFSIICSVFVQKEPLGINV
jgi:hypothetical protein